MKRILSLTAVVMIVLTFSACKLYNIEGSETVSEYALIATDGSDLAILDQYPNLEYVDLRGSSCYEDILDYSASHPNVKVRFSIALGELIFNHDVTEMKLPGSDVTFMNLMENLKYFRSLNTVHIDQISFSKTQLDELKKTYPQINLTYTVKIGSTSHDSTLTELNLSAITSEHVDEAIAAFELMPDLATVDFGGSPGKSALSFADVEKIMEAHPDLSYRYQFKLFGKNLSQETKSLTYSRTNIGNNGLNQIREALALMPDCTYICLDDCNIDDETMAKFREEFPDVNIVWRVFIDKYSVLTDAEVILMQNTVDDTEARPLQYCTNVKYLDLTGCKIRNFDFLINMPNLECAVLQLTHFSDSSVLQNAKNLTWLNLANCSSLRDASALSNLTNLKYLNLSATKIRDISPLDILPLERFKCAKSSISDEEFSNFQSKHPNCLATDTGSVVGKGWRYDDAAQKQPCAYYAEMMKIFGYEK